MTRNNIDTHFLLLPMHGFLLAFSFLTRLPVYSSKYKNQSVWNWSIVFYPMCGYVIACIALLPFFGLIKTNLLLFVNPITPIVISSLAYLAISEWMTRMLHFDGFCDCMDSFSAMTTSKERRLEIMKDPHIGSSALGGGIILLLTKYCAVYYLLMKSFILSHTSLLTISIIIISISGIARFAMIVLAATSKYPRKDGTAFTVVGKIPLVFIALSLLTLVPVIFLLGREIFFIMILISFLIIIFWKIKAYKMLGGVTGDVMGASCETIEVFLLLSMLYII